MMLLKDLFTLLATGELSNIALSNNSTGGINEAQYDKIIGHINLGIIELYKRFKLMENELILHVTPDQTIYKLQLDKVIFDIPETEKYLEFASNQTRINIIEITGIFDSLGNELAINNRYTTPSIQQVSLDILRFSQITEPMILSLMYQSYPDRILLDDDFELNSCVLNIPEILIEALVYYIAYRIYKPTGANNSTANADKSASYQQQYELACQKFDLLGLGIQNCDNANKFESQGWA